MIGSIPFFLMKNSKAFYSDICLCMPSHMSRLLGFGLCCFGHKSKSICCFVSPAAPMTCLMADSIDDRLHFHAKLRAEHPECF